MGPTFLGLSAALLVLASIFFVLERLWPSVPRRARPWRTRLTDASYWFFTPLVTRTLTRAALIVPVVLVAALYGVTLERETVLAWLTTPRGLVVGVPRWGQVMLVLLLGDLLGYLAHRAFHHGRLWRVHAVHHSSRTLDWLSSTRLHPLNEAVQRALVLGPLLLVGFEPGILAAYAPFLTLYAILLHANVSWSFGPLGGLIASPTFHRWHHSAEEEGLDRNFAGLFPFIDRLFGTLHMPAGRRPQAFGLAGEEMPEGLLAQLLHPLRRNQPSRPPATVTM